MEGREDRRTRVAEKGAARLPDGVTDGCRYLIDCVSLRENTGFEVVGLPGSPLPLEERIGPRDDRLGFERLGRPARHDLARGGTLDVGLQLDEVQDVQLVTSARNERERAGIAAAVHPDSTQSLHAHRASTPKRTHADSLPLRNDGQRCPLQWLPIRAKRAPTESDRVDIRRDANPQDGVRPQRRRCDEKAYCEESRRAAEQDPSPT